MLHNWHTFRYVFGILKEWCQKAYYSRSWRSVAHALQAVSCTARLSVGWQTCWTTATSSIAHIVWRWARASRRNVRRGVTGGRRVSVCLSVCCAAHLTRSPSDAAVSSLSSPLVLTAAAAVAAATGAVARRPATFVVISGIASTAHVGESSWCVCLRHLCMSTCADIFFYSYGEYFHTSACRYCWPASVNKETEL